MGEILDDIEGMPERQIQIQYKYILGRKEILGRRQIQIHSGEKQEPWIWVGNLLNYVAKAQNTQTPTG